MAHAWLVGVTTVALLKSSTVWNEIAYVRQPVQLEYANAMFALFTMVVRSRTTWNWIRQTVFPSVVLIATAALSPDAFATIGTPAGTALTTSVPRISSSFFMWTSCFTGLSMGWPNRSGKRSAMGWRLPGQSATGMRWRRSRRRRWRTHWRTGWPTGAVTEPTSAAAEAAAPTRY